MTVRCPDCGSSRVWKNGFRKTSNGERVQTYICAKCYRKFTEPSKVLNINRRYYNNGDEDPSRAGFGSETGGLVLEKPLETVKQPAGGTEKNVENLLVGFALWLRKQGRSEETIKTYITVLRKLAKNVDLYDPEAVEKFLADSKIKETTKNTYVDGCTHFSTASFFGSSLTFTL